MILASLVYLVHAVFYAPTGFENNCSKQLILFVPKAVHGTVNRFPIHICSLHLLVYNKL